MTLGDSIIFLFLSVGIVFLYGWLFRQYRIDVFRQRVFALRDEVFDYAAKGNISFDHPAYISLRTLMNGYIRYSHRISMLNAFIGMTLTGLFNKGYKAKSFEETWHSALDDLDGQVLVDMRNFRTRTDAHLFYYLFMSSLFKKIAIIPVIIPVIIELIPTLFSTKKTATLDQIRAKSCKTTTEHSSQAKHAIEYLNEDAFCVGGV